MSASDKRDYDPYPEGTLWRCLRCDFTTDDDGPDYCPNDGLPLVRTAGRIRLDDDAR